MVRTQIIRGPFMPSGTLSQGEEAEPLDALIREFTRIVSEPWPFLIESCMSTVEDFLRLQIFRKL